MKTSTVARCAVICSLLVCGSRAADTDKSSLAGFDDFMASAMQEFKVPGAAVAIVKDGKIILAKGYGYRDVAHKQPITGKTLFPIASITKSFTVTSLGTLVDEGKLDWDKPVREYLPGFRMYDPVATEQLTTRDMVTHRSGLPRHDLVWYSSSFSREELVNRLRYLEPNKPLREKFQYNNLMFLTAGYLVETLTGKKWEDAVRGLVFDPLDMTRSNFNVADSQKDSDYAQPYADRDQKVVKIPFRNITNIGPAGAINSSVNEMSHWVMVHINDGAFKGKQLISAATIADMHTPYMPTGGTPARPDISSSDYGLAWFIDTYRGHQRVEHGGNIDGFSALVSLFPKDGIGFVVLTNKNGTGLPDLIVQTAADRIFGLEAVDWIGDAAKKMAQGAEAEKKAEEKKTTRRRLGTVPSHKLDEYAGDYNHPGYGDLKVSLAMGKLSFTYNAITTPLEHWHFETFNGAKTDDPTFQDMKLTFRTDVNGNVSAVVAPFEPTEDDIVFARKPDAKLSDPAYLKKVSGEYDFSGQRVTVSPKGGRLTLTMPGQPTLDLVPGLGGEYSLKQAMSITVKFVEDAAGQVTGLAINQPNGVFEAKRIK